MSEKNVGDKGKTDQPVQRIIVIGGSTGGLEAMRTIVRKLPSDFDTPILIVWHMSSDIRGILPTLLNRENKIPAAHARDNEPLRSNRIYVAPPDYHLMVRDGVIRVTHGPKENRFRPAIDPLFRSAAYAYGGGVIGVVLTGALDDGTAGLWTIKHFGGIAVVQDPHDAEVPSMPENAMREVEIDYSVPVSEMADLLVRLSKEPVQKTKIMEDAQTKREIEIAAEESGMAGGELKFGELSPYTCPECHGVLSRLHNDKIVRYRCHTGHAYSADALMATISERIEDSLYSAIRGIDESILLLNHMGDHYAEINKPKLAAVYFQKAKEADERAQLVRKAVKHHEQLSKESLEQQAGIFKDYVTKEHNGE